MAKICDFGCSIITEKLTGTEVVMSTNIGTPAYSDGRIEGGKPYDMSVDIYSLGMTFLSIFKGKGYFDDCCTKK